MSLFALFPYVLAFGLPSPVTVTWLEGPSRPVIVCQQWTVCAPVVAISVAGSCAEHGPRLELQWSRIGTSTTRASLTVVVSSSTPLSTVAVTTPGRGTTTWVGLASEGRTTYSFAHADARQAGTLSVRAVDAGGCVVQMEGVR